MDSFFLSIPVFIGAVAIHVILHRSIRAPTVALVAYPAGFIFLIVIARGSAYPLTTTVLYALLVVGYLLFFLSFLNDAESPSAKALEVVRSRGPISKAEVVSRFTNEELIGMRVRRLISAGWIAKEGRTIVATRRGAVIAGMFHWYRHLLGWDEGG